MTKLDEIRQWKRKWGYDDTAVMPGGRTARPLRPDARKLDKLATQLDADAARRLRGTFENPASTRLKLVAARLKEANPALARRLVDEAERIRLAELSPDGALLAAAADAIDALGPPPLKDPLDPRAPADPTDPSDLTRPDGLREWAHDLAQPYDPAQGPLATSIADRIRSREILDRTAVVDQVTNVIYSTDRRQELLALTGNHYLAQAFGQRAIKERFTNGQARSGIRFDHDSSSTYQRDAVSDSVTADMRAIYAKAQAADRTMPRLAPTAAEEKRVFFVNNPDVAAKLDKVYGPDWKEPKGNKSFKALYARTVQIQPGLYAVLMKAPGVDAAFREKLLEGSGCTPSAYQVEKVKDSTTAAVDPLTAPSMRDATIRPANDAKLDTVVKSAGARHLAALPADSPMKQSAQAASQMVTGLQAALKKLEATPDKWAALKDNKLVASALGKIERLMETMPSYTEDAPRFAKLFDLLVDEVYLVLATCKPYDQADYRKAAGEMIEERIPVLKTDEMREVRHSTALLSSGMDCLSTAVAAAFARTGAKQVTLVDAHSHFSANYFEVEANLLGGDTLATGAKPKPGGPAPFVPPVIMGTLNPSTPVKQAMAPARGKGGAQSWTVDELIRRIHATIAPHEARLTTDKPAVVIVDVTVERNASGADQEMNKLVADPKVKALLKAGKLELMLAKSYQKYPSLGAGKAMSGGLTVIGKGVDAGREPLKSVAAAEKAEGLLPGSGNASLPQGHDESQIVAHFMAHGRGAERAMLERAAKNAKFVRGLMPPDGEVGNELVRFDDGLPFIVLPKAGLPVPGRPPRGGTHMANVSVALQQQGVEERMSFGFQNSSCLTTTRGMMRIGIGQESEEDLVEKLYAITNIAARTPLEAPRGGTIPAVTPAGMVQTAGAAANRAMVQAKAALATKGKAGPSAQKDWRERMVRVLVDAGLLKAGEVARDKDGAITAPLDADLQKRLDAVADDTSTTDLAQLTRKVALVAALRRDRAHDPAIELTTTPTPKDKPGRDDWIAKAEQALKARGAALPARAKDDADGARYVDALRGALHGEDDANLIHAGTRAEWDGPGGEKLGVEARFLPSIVASCANLIATTLQSPADFKTLADTVIDGGLEELSPEGRERLLQRRVQASLAGGEAAVAGDLAQLGKVAGQMPYREGLANLLKGDDLLDSGKTLKAGTLKAVVETLSKPLDLTTACDVFEQLAAAAARDDRAKRVALQFKPVLAARFEATKAAYVEPGLAPQKAEPPARPMVPRDIRRGATGTDTHGPQAMKKEEFESLRGRFDRVAATVT